MLLSPAGQQGVLCVPGPLRAQRICAVLRSVYIRPQLSREAFTLGWVVGGPFWLSHSTVHTLGAMLPGQVVVPVYAIPSCQRNLEAYDTALYGPMLAPPPQRSPLQALVV